MGWGIGVDVGRGVAVEVGLGVRVRVFVLVGISIDAVAVFASVEAFAPQADRRLVTIIRIKIVFFMVGSFLFRKQKETVYYCLLSYPNLLNALRL